MKKCILPIAFGLAVFFAGCQKKDTTPPYLRLNGTDDTTIVLNTRYVDPGAFAKDEMDAELQPIVLGTVNWDSVGVYVLTFVVRDNADNEARVSRTVRVVNFSEAYSGLYSVKEEITVDNVTTTSEYNLDLIVSPYYNRRMIIKDVAGYTSINAQIEMRDTSVFLYWQEFPSADPAISKIIIHGCEGTYTSDGFKLQFVVQEVDTSSNPKSTYKLSAPVYKKL